MTAANTAGIRAWLAAGVFTLAAAASAQPYGAAPGMPDPAGGTQPHAAAAPDPFASLGLGDEQRAALEALMEEQRRTHWQNLERMQRHAGELAELYQGERWDAERIGAVYDRIFALQRQNIVASVRMRNRIMDLLTPQQRQALKQRFGDQGPGRQPGAMAPGMGLDGGQPQAPAATP